MPTLRKLSQQINGILPKTARDLTVFSTSAVSQFEVITPDALIDSQNLHPSNDFELLISGDNGDLTDSSSSSTSISPPVRKRQRLDHLSQEEKILRRKLKNRVAAQSARDRKKARMTELEEQVVQLEEQQKILLLKNAELRNKNAKLEEQNAELKLRLGLTPSQVQVVNASTNDVESRVVEEGRSLEYAEGTGFATSYTLDDAIRLLASSSEAGDFFDLLQQYSDELLQGDFSNTQPENLSIRNELSDEGKMVGPTSKGMESIKELINFDHIYYKQTEAGLPDNLPATLPSESKASELDSEASVLSTTISIPTSEPSVEPIPDIQIIQTTHVNEDFESTPYTPNKISDTVCSTKLSPYRRVPSPSSSDAGYDSSFSARSPVSDVCSADSPMLPESNSWDTTFTELFPTLV